ncbi:AAA family ATPase [uncultured Porphyromonas sp.]|jgi:ATPase associated with various cellular activities AAA_5|uniref:McrB family protein n=1 Tax=uncultured Porphyromonas sp. TaxID=159274 RepID=UPI0025CC5A75|nr:AAA family ATPase [uncultured Porphyromonas sp.]
MAGLFNESDFDLIAQYAGKKQKDVPEPYDKLKAVYDKLGHIMDGLKGLGYHTDIKRHPLFSGNWYAPYHWGRAYPKQQPLQKECHDKVFFVVGTDANGINIHIDSYSSKGYSSDDTEAKKKIKKDTWLQIPPAEASTYTCEELVKIVDDYIQKNWVPFNLFAREFGIKESIRILEEMNREVENTKTLLLANHNIVLTGAPGTGKTYLAKEVAKKMDAVFKIVQFHPSYDYTDFVEGLRPVNQEDSLGFQRMDGVFKKFCKEALQDGSHPYVFIIDEINRGEISKIFGELFYSIDRGYRGEKGRVSTQYQNLVKEDDEFHKGFYVPENVYIIGTMNDIDRSVDSMDFALRRRFAWKEITAESRISMLDDETAWGGRKPEQSVIEELKRRMTNLNNCIIDQYPDQESTPKASKDRIGLTKSYQIGASYFLKYMMYGNFDALWEYHLKGLLYEYLRGTSHIEEKIERLHTAYNALQ